ncbi:MAG: hypothetical protein ABI037_09950 [Gemmatimonadales bacterium]
MSANEVTCELVDERDLDTRYLSGRIIPEEAEAFEAHFFGCERCWGLVHQGLAVRSAFQPDASLAGSSSRPVSPQPSAARRWWGLAAAAGIGAVAFGVWGVGSRSEDSKPEDVLRGDRAPFVLVPAADRAALTATWPGITDADVYRVRLYAAEGTLVAERELSDTTVALVRDSLQMLPGGDLFWEVQALDRLRNPIARSELTRAVLPSSPP